MEKFSLKFRDKPVQSILQRGESKFVQLSFKPGQGLTKHRAPLALTVVVLTGRVLFTVDDKTEVLEASEMLTVDPAVEHAIEAVEKSTVLLVLTPDVKQVEAPVSVANRPLEHENVYRHPELIEQIAPELRALVEDHMEVCKTLESVVHTPDQETIRTALWAIKGELDSHFVAEEEVLFPRMAAHVGGMDVGPVARLIEEHAHIRRLHAEAEELMTAWEQTGDEHAQSLLSEKVAELSRALLNHLGKEDSHLFPMASRLMTAEEKSVIAIELKAFKSSVAQ
ncbi:MAG: hemerythrin domain-containing protein [Alicyclobacillus sp.]|nr:hemerythrin domain-containing protein [Alicyclobacillus sp.]